MVRLWSLSPRPPALFGPSVNRMLGTESGIGLATDGVWETLVGLLDRFSRAAEEHAARFDVGISPNEVRKRIGPILGDLRRIEHAGWEALPGGNALRECLERLRELAPNTYRKTLARIAGVSVIHAHFRSRMTEEDIGRAIAASSLYEMTQDLLDDLLDGGGWTFPEAVRLYDRCLRPLTDSTVAMEGLEADLADLMGPEQDGLERILAEATQELRGLLDSGDERVRRLLAKGHEALTRAQCPGRDHLLPTRDARYRRNEGHRHGPSLTGPVPPVARSTRDLRVMAFEHRPLRCRLRVVARVEQRTDGARPRMARLRRGHIVLGTLRGIGSRCTRRRRQRRMHSRVYPTGDPWRRLVPRIRAARTPVHLREGDRMPGPRHPRGDGRRRSSGRLRVLGAHDPDDHLCVFPHAVRTGGHVLSHARPGGSVRGRGRPGDLGGHLPGVTGTTK